LHFRQCLPVNHTLNRAEGRIASRKQQIDQALWPVSRVNAKPVARQNAPQRRQRASHPRCGFGPPRSRCRFSLGDSHSDRFTCFLPRTDDILLSKFLAGRLSPQIIGNRLRRSPIRRYSEVLAAGCRAKRFCPRTIVSHLGFPEAELIASHDAHFVAPAGLPC